MTELLRGIHIGGGRNIHIRGSKNSALFPLLALASALYAPLERFIRDRSMYLSMKDTSGSPDYENCWTPSEIYVALSKILQQHCCNPSNGVAAPIATTLVLPTGS